MKSLALSLALLLAPLVAIAADPTLSASYRINTPSGSGSGVGLSPNLCITNRHVVGGKMLPSVRVFHTLSKESHQGQVVAVSNVADLALIWCNDGGLETAPIAQSEPRPGEDVWIIGYGRRAVLRGGTYKLIRTAGENYVTRIGTEPGDSGSGMFNASGELIGLHWGYYGNPDEAWCVPGYRIRELLGAFVKNHGRDLGIALDQSGRVTKCDSGGFQAGGGCASGNCGGGDFQAGGCSDGSCGSGFSGRGRGPMRPVSPDDFERPPSPTLPQPVAQAPTPSTPAPATPAPAVPAACPCDSGAIDARLAEINARLDGLSETDKKLTDTLANLAGNAGLPGPPGPPGPAGPAPDLDALAAAVLLKIRADLGVPADGIDLSAAAKVSHLAVIVDRNDPAYARIAGEIQAASQQFPKIHEIGVEQLPWKLTPLPQLVVYDTQRQATQIAKGARDVSAVLQRVQRGELAPR